MKSIISMMMVAVIMVLLASCNDLLDPSDHNTDEIVTDQIDQSSGQVTEPLQTGPSLAAAQSCYGSTGFSLVGGHFAYRMSYRPPSYDAYLAGFKIRADPYSSNSVLVQKRDLCWICGCNPWCGQVYLRVCSK